MPLQSNLAIDTKILNVQAGSCTGGGGKYYKEHYWGKTEMWTDQTKVFNQY